MFEFISFVSWVGKLKLQPKLHTEYIRKFLIDKCQSMINIKARKPDELREWYRRHLSVPIEEWDGAAFRWQSPDMQKFLGVEEELRAISEATEECGALVI